MNRSPEFFEARLMRFFLARIRRLAMLDLYIGAHKAGLLEAEHIGGRRSNGTIWLPSAKFAQAITCSPGRDRLTLGKILRASTAKTLRSDAYDEDVETPDDRTAHLQPVASVLVSREALPRLHSFLPQPDVSRVAVALLVARALRESLPDMQPVRIALVNPISITLIKAPVGGFERGFSRSLEDGLIMPFWITLADVLGSYPPPDRYGDARQGVKRRRVASGSCRAFAKVKEGHVRRRIGKALIDEKLPLVIVDEREVSPMRSIVDTADLVLECNGFDNAMLAQLLFHCLGLPVGMSLQEIEAADLDLSRLHIDDLVMAVRPGRSVGAILATLRTLLLPYDDDAADSDKTEGEEKASGKKGGGGKKVSAAAAIEIIQPEQRPDDCECSTKVTNRTSASRSAYMSIDTLSGYGYAKSWAHDLKLDLDAWRAGEIAWGDMSSKLLLSGPPGTGKTTYARALCNSLDIPMVISSVTSWLEPGYLGDVLQRMSAAFRTAQENAPCILFIDEIDGIGSRGNAGAGSKQYDDYWTSLINRLLELLDGARKSEGVIIVAATNLPDRIDPALLRSGRLEKHVAIPRPDIDALTGIFAHHLGGDLESVAASAPPLRSPGRLKPGSAKNAVPLKVRKSVPSSQPPKGPHYD